ncbi:sulfatase-like hydrolase/transferase [bacterium]|nr:sulfatase-like hydrolase/transferase [bacterium]
MNILLLVVDSLRAQSLAPEAQERPKTPFLDWLGTQTVHFRRAYATECWTLPTHTSIFTGLLPSEHGAHFQTMAYRSPAPTIAEILSAAGWHTEIVTRNFIFDGTIPGITRGFRRNTQILSDTGRLNPFALFLALAKPRFRRHVRETGFFHPKHQQSRRFLTTFARAMLPADAHSLEYVLRQASSLHAANRKFFIFSNLYDVHAPYPPRPDSILRPSLSIDGVRENLTLPRIMSKLGAHEYLREGFRIPPAGGAMLLARYHRAIELMDTKLERFYKQARDAGLLENTLLIITSDHGEAFGEHGLYLHDASVYDTHLHVPLWVHHPGQPAAAIDDVVSTRDLFSLMKAAAFDSSVAHTILDPGYRDERPVALAEHFYYPHIPDARPIYRCNLTAGVSRDVKIIIRQSAMEQYDVSSDAAELHPINYALQDLSSHGDSPPHRVVFDHIARWRTAAPFEDRAH